MARSLAICCVVLAALAGARASGVLEIKGQEDLHAAIDAHPVFALLIYSPYDSEWEELEPAWAAAAADLADEAVTLATLDGTAPPAAFVMQELSVRKFPTILTWKRHFHHRRVAYNGSLDAASLAAFLRRRAADPAPLLATKDAVDAFWAGVTQSEAEHSAGVVAFLPPAAAAALAAFQAVGDTAHQNIATAYVTDRALIDAPCSGPDCDSPIAVLQKKGGAKEYRYDGAFEEGPLRTWAESRAAPLVVRYSSMVGVRNPGFSRAAEVRAPHIFGVFKNEDELTPEVQEAFEAAAEANPDLKFFLTTAEQGFLLCDYLGVGSGHRLPAFLASEHWERRRFGKEGVAVANLPEFIEEYRQGALKRWIKSEDADDGDDEYDEGDDEDGGDEGDEYDDGEEEEGEKKGGAAPTGVVKVTANTWDAKVAAADKPILLMFTGNFCKRCEDMGESLQEMWLASGGGEYIAATMDGVKNDVLDQRFTVRDYPTFFWVPPGADAPVVRFERKMDEGELRAFVEERLGRGGAAHDEL